MKNPHVDPALLEMLSHPTLPADATEALHMARAWLAGSAIDLGELPEELALAAVEQATRLQRADLLVTPMGAGASKALRKAVARSLHALRSRGLSVQAETAPRAFRLQAESADGIRKALFHRSESGWGLLLVASDSVQDHLLGVEMDAAGTLRSMFLKSHELGRNRSVIRDFSKNPQLVELPFVSGLALALRSMQSDTTSIVPPLDWERFQSAVPESTALAARVLDPWHGLETELDASRLDLAPDQDPGSLLSSFVPIEGLFQPVISKLMARFASTNPEQPSQDSEDGILYDGIDLWCQEQANRELLARSMDLGALFQLHQSSSQAASLFRNTAHALRQGESTRTLPLMKHYSYFLVMYLMDKMNRTPSSAPNMGSFEAE